MVTREKNSLIVFPLLIFSLFLFSFAIAEEPAVDAEDISETYDLSIQTDNGLLTVNADSVPLDIVLEELARESGSEMKVDTTLSIEEDLVTFSFTGLTLTKALERILKDYSYVIKEENNRMNIFVMASKVPGNPTTVAVKENKLAEIFSGASGKDSGTGSYKGSINVNRVEEVAQEARPHDLDECQELEFTEFDAGRNIAHLESSLSSSDEEGYDDEKPVQPSPLLKEVHEENRKELIDAKIKRAKKVLDMEKCSHLWENAVEELVGIQDDRVTSMLADIAGTGRTEGLRLKAVEALWHNTADSEFKNMKGINSLKRLTGSSDSNVSTKAQQALKDYEKYTAREKKYSQMQ